jgi:quercetin dioxygenase-like cupin family protein
MFFRSIAMTLLIVSCADCGWAQEIKRREISRADLTGTNMEVVLVETEIPPGAFSQRHTHPGEEAFYVLEGTTVEAPGQPPIVREAGTGGINARDVPHAGYKVVGDKPLKMVNVYIVDKGKPIATPVR